MSSSSRRRSSLPPMVFEEFKIPRRRAPSAISKNSSSQSLNPIDNGQTKPEASNRYYSKNAFRYICRIALKEGHSMEFREKVTQICEKNAVELSEVLRVFSKAETVSGPRYFQHMMEDQRIEVVKAVVDYLTWFLRCRYFRYLDRGQSLKRKPNNREEYLKYKNFVMIPMLRSMLHEHSHNTKLHL